MGSLTKDDREEVIQAWYMNDINEDQRQPHHKDPKEFVSFEKLNELGVHTWRLDADNHVTDPKLKKIRETHGYSKMNLYEVSPKKLSNYEEMVELFYKEHFHSSEEVSFCLEGSGFYDVRDHGGAWIRIWVKKGAMLSLPSRIYHRFTLDSDEYIKIIAFNAVDLNGTTFKGDS